MTLSREELLTGLVDTYGYPPQGAAVVAAKLLNLQPQLRQEFEQWWREGTLPTLNVEGYTAEQLMQERHLTPIAAILTLDWLVREPQKALEAIVRGADVVKPHSR